MHVFDLTTHEIADDVSQLEINALAGVDADYIATLHFRPPPLNHGFRKLERPQYPQQIPVCLYDKGHSS